MPTLTYPNLLRITRDMIVAAGTPPDLAEIVADVLVEANLQGHDSHGVLRLPWYIEQIRGGRIVADARASVRSREGATAIVDGALGWGPPAARFAADTAIALAAENGVGAVTIVRGNHIGRVGEYVTQIARREMIGIVFCNASPAVAP